MRVMHELDQVGFRHLPGAVADHLAQIQDRLREVPAGRAGVRLDHGGMPDGMIAGNGWLGRFAREVLGDGTRPVRAILFDKSADANWSLGWHQDRTICVAERRDAPGFGPWTVKQGLVHVMPPAGLLDRMVTMRVHLDDVGEANAPLLVAEGSHRLGRIAEADVDGVVAPSDIRTCLARAGDIWLYRTLILHASARALRPARRRVLQIDYAAEDLPHGLVWAMP